MAQYDKGDVARLAVTFKDVTNLLIDPTLVCIQIKQPDDSEIHYNYPSDYQIEKVSTGQYRHDFLITQDGVHYFKWTGSGNINAAEEKMFFVRPTQIEGQC